MLQKDKAAFEEKLMTPACALKIFGWFFSQIKEEAGKSKPAKRTASFNIRRRTRSLKDKHKLPANLPPVDLEGLLERKQELQAGGKKATIRSWKSYYAVLFGQLLCFFKDREGENFFSFAKGSMLKT